jgi:hypothetical protein
MLEDALLERLFGEAADTLTLPDDGPEKILAARDAMAPTRPAIERPSLGWARRRPMRTVAAVIASVVVVGVVAAVASGGGGSNVASPSEHRSSAGALAIAGAGGGTASASGAVAPAALPASPPVAGGSASAPNLVPGSPQAKVVKSGSITLQVGSVESTTQRLSDLTSALGGYMASMSSSDPGAGQVPSADLSIRVPEASFEPLVAQVRSLGIPSQVTISGQDVTSEYADLKARLQALQSTINQLQLIESKAVTIGDVLAVEQQVSAEQTQADQIQGQMNVLDDQATYGSLAVHVVQRAEKTITVPPPPNGLSKAWDHARHSFTHGVEAVLAALGGIAVFLLFAALLIGAVWAGWVRLRRRLV